MSTSDTGMPGRVSVPVGTRTVAVAKLRMGQLRADDALRAAVGIIQTLTGDGALPTAAQSDAMLRIAAAGTVAAGVPVSMDDLGAWLDELPYNEGYLALAQCMGTAMRTTTDEGGPATGEAAGPVAEPEAAGSPAPGSDASTG